MKKKKIIAIICTFACSLMNIFPVCAKEESLPIYSTDDKDSLGLKDNVVWHDMSDIDKLTRDDVFTYDELISYLTSNGYTTEEAYRIAGKEHTQTRSTSSTIYYSLMRMKNWYYYDEDPYGERTFIMQARFTVGLEYVDGSPSPVRMVSLEGAHVYTGDGEKCSFSGEMIYKLQSGKSIYYNFFGNLYEEGTVSWQIAATVYLGKSGSVSATIVGPDGFLSNISHSETYTNNSLIE